MSPSDESQGGTPSRPRIPQSHFGANQDLLAEIVEAAGDGIYSRTLDGIVTSWSPGAERISGYSADEMIGSSISIFTVVDTVEATTEHVLQGAAAQQPDVECVRKDGRHLFVSTMLALLTDARGTAIGIGGIMRDVTARKEVEERERFQAQLLNAVGQAVVATDRNGTVTYCNRAAEDLLGYQAVEILGRDVAVLIPESVRPGVSETVSDRLVTDGSWAGEYGIRRRDGTLVPVLTSVNAIRDAGGEIVSFIGVATDISQQKRAEEALRESEERYRTVVEATPDGIAIVDLQGTVQFANEQFAQMLGYASPADIVGKPGLELVLAEDREIAERELRTIVQRGSIADVRCRQQRADGSVFPAQLSGRLIHDEHGAPVGIVAVMRDISDQAAYEDQLRHLALHDTLTDLPNRTLLMDRLDHALAACRRNVKPLALLLMDLDNFKEINDTYGHQLGDLVLVETARRLGSDLRQSDTIARLGGDEFAIVLSDADMMGSLQTISRLVSLVGQPIDLGDQRFQIGASFGIALAPHHGATAEELLRHADVAMYTAKRANSGHAVYSPEQDSFSPLRLALINELRTAIETDQLILHFQPKLNLQSGLVEMAEALVRWQHPAHGLIPPDRFIGLAEHSGLIRPLTTWVVRHALAQCREWRLGGLDVGICVNLSARSLHDHELPGSLAESLREAGVPADRFMVEITESTIMAEPERAMEVLRNIEELGIAVAIDDFGTGYSSLGYLRNLGAIELKIDKSFVFELAADQPDAFIVKAIIDLGHNLGLKVVAEGVESQAVLDILGALQCDWVQGYHLSRPQAAATLTQWLRHRPDVRRMGHQIVVVDDDPGLRGVLTDLLSDAGYSVFPVKGPAEAVELPRSLAPALFLIDIMLPGISGLELAEVLQQRGFTAPMVATTASHMMQGLALDSGNFAAVLPKPFDTDVLLSTISKILGGDG